MHKDEVSHAFTCVYRSFFKGRRSKVRSDHCEPVGLIVHYDDANRVNYIEIVPPVHGTVTLELFGVEATGFSVRQIVELLRRHASDVARRDYGYACPSLGLTTFNSDPRDESARIECIGVGPRGGPAAA
ncbi:MAG TPA: hypothetical protein VH253_19020 [Phycisphaerae bacterium]|nr:hypothetical protein [Phycisphaerae bacterium]